jgi:hypothetical protein
MERDHLEDLALDKRIIKFWIELIAYFLMICHRQQRILCPIIVMSILCHRNVLMYLLSHCLAMIRGHEKQANRAELLKVMFSLQPNPNSYMEKDSLLRTVVTGQSVCKNQRLGRPHFWPHYFGFLSSGATYNKHDYLRRWCGFI